MQNRAGQFFLIKKIIYLIKMNQNSLKSQEFVNTQI